jgi:hypothetical protein
METFEHQEMRARRRVSWSAVWKTGLGMGIYLFIFSGGTPWTSGGVARGVMGWTVEWPWLLVAVSHFALCLAVVAALAAAIYRWHWVLALGVGTVVALAAYALEYPLFATDAVANGRAFSAHLVLGLFGSALYKALSVPKPMMTPKERAEVEAKEARPAEEMSRLNRT